MRLCMLQEGTQGAESRVPASIRRSSAVGLEVTEEWGEQLMGWEMSVTIGGA